MAVAQLNSPGRGVRSSRLRTFNRANPQARGLVSWFSFDHPTTGLRDRVYPDVVLRPTAGVPAFTGVPEGGMGLRMRGGAALASGYNVDQVKLSVVSYVVVVKFLVTPTSDCQLFGVQYDQAGNSPYAVGWNVNLGAGDKPLWYPESPCFATSTFASLGQRLTVLIGTYTGTDANAYVNGVFQTNVGIATPTYTSTTFFTMSGPDDYILYDARIYNRNLTNGEIERWGKNPSILWELGQET